MMQRKKALQKAVRKVVRKNTRTQSANASGQRLRKKRPAASKKKSAN